MSIFKELYNKLQLKKIVLQNFTGNLHTTDL